jgi:acyl-CoA reductase-like NAD-dependent aldehyde dehydrogenase
MERIEVLKTYKLYIGGQFPRTESGRYYALKNKQGATIANVCLASRKDFRNAVVAARGAFAGWSSRSGYNRSQILYRIAEMMEGRKQQLVEELLLQGISKSSASTQVETGIDHWVYFAGWCDKYQQVFSAVNPVQSSHFNFSVPESTGVVAAIAAQDSPLLSAIDMIAAAIAGGNTVIILASSNYPLGAITLGEIIATSDVPGGVVNILTGKVEELLGQFASHMDVNALVLPEISNDLLTKAKLEGANNVKRVCHYKNINWERGDFLQPYPIMDLQEIKTTWHPIEQVGSSGSKY